MKKWKNSYLLSASLCFCLFSWSCKVRSNNSATNFISTGGGGHMELTVYSLEQANKQLGINFYPIRTGRNNLIVKGNIATDFVSQDSFNEFVSLYNRDSQISDLAWGKQAHLQTIHFLRNFTDKTKTKTQTAVEACRGSVEQIKKASLRALSEFEKGKKDTFLFDVGHVAHIIQDSFSTEHTRRNPSNPRILDDICIYGAVPVSPGAVCTHNTLLAASKDGDNAYLPSNCGAGDDRNSDCNDYSVTNMKSSGKLAANITIEYLKMMYKATSASETAQEKMLETFLTHDSSYNGYFDCNKVSKREFGPILTNPRANDNSSDPIGDH